MRELDCAHVLTAAASAAAHDHTIRLDGESIASVEPATRATEPLFALPALANARATRSSSFGTAGKPLEIWPLARLRHGIAQNAALATALPELERVVRNHFETPCC
jgi:hypothetical protein